MRIFLVNSHPRVRIQVCIIRNTSKSATYPVTIKNINGRSQINGLNWKRNEVINLLNQFQLKMASRKCPEMYIKKLCVCVCVTDRCDPVRRLKMHRATTRSVWILSLLINFIAHHFNGSHVDDVVCSHDVCCLCGLNVPLVVHLKKMWNVH